MSFTSGDIALFRTKVNRNVELVSNMQYIVASLRYFCDFMVFNVQFILFVIC
jgi:hypothetical protein